MTATSSLLVWPVALPKNRVGGSAVFSFVFAFQYIGQTLDTPAENGGCGYDFASGVHKYLYAEDDPVDGSDPSGNQDTTTELAVENADASLDAMPNIVTINAEKEIAFGSESELQNDVDSAKKKNPGDMVFLHATATGVWPELLWNVAPAIKPIGYGEFGEGPYTFNASLSDPNGKNVVETAFKWAGIAKTRFGGGKRKC